MGVPWRARQHYPRVAVQVRELGDERKRSVIGISPESRNEADGRFVDAAVVGICGTGEAIAAEASTGRSASCQRVVPSDVNVAVVAVNHEFGRSLIFNAQNSRIGVNGREPEPAGGVRRWCHDEVWNVGVADLATAAAAVVRSFENLEILKDFEIAIERARGAMDRVVPEVSSAIGR